MSSAVEGVNKCAVPFPKSENVTHHKNKLSLCNWTFSSFQVQLPKLDLLQFKMTWIYETLDRHAIPHLWAAQLFVLLTTDRMTVG